MDGRIPDSGSDDLLEGRIPLPKLEEIDHGPAKSPGQSFRALIGSLIGDRPLQEDGIPYQLHLNRREINEPCNELIQALTGFSSPGTNLQEVHHFIDEGPGDGPGSLSCLAG